MFLIDETPQANVLVPRPKRMIGNFTGLNSFMQYASGLPTHHVPFRGASIAQNSFYYFNTFDDACNVFFNKAHTLVKFVESELDLFKKDEIGNDHWMDVTGDFLDVGTFLEGDPECFGNMFMGNPKKTFATLILKLDVPWSANVDYLVFYAARILRLIEWLERKEIRTRVLCFSSTEIEHIEISIKDFYEPLTLAHIAIISNPDFYRRFIFRIRENSHHWNPSYGSTEERDKEHITLFPELTKRHSSIIMYMDRSLYENNRDVTTEAFDSAEEFMRKMLADEVNQGAFII